MRGRSNDYCFLDPMIISILKEYDAPVQALCISFKINEKLSKIIGLNVIRSHLDNLVTKKKVIKNVSKDETVLYSIKKKKDSLNQIKKCL